MSFQDQKLVRKSKPSNSLNEGQMKQLQSAFMNESGDENGESENQSIATNVSETKRSKTIIQQNQSQDKSMIMDNIRVDSDKITFLSEKDFKFEKNCWVCKILFGKMNDRQHHCRLCSHSVCKICSQKRVNDNRVCDICFLKMKNVKGEKRKKKLLAAMKNFIKNLSTNITKGNEENKKLESKCKNLKDQAKIEEEKRQIELEILKSKLAQIQRSKETQEKKLREHENLLEVKKVDRQRRQDELNDFQTKQKIIVGDIKLQQDAYKSRYDQLNQLYQQKKDLQNQESFLRLPNYERAKRNDPENMCEAVIFLDNNDQRNGINHYNTVSNNNVFQSTSDSNNVDKHNTSQNYNQQKNDKTEYASSYNQGLMDADHEIVNHSSRKRKQGGSSKKSGNCLCD
ncbi:hypothetical protein ABPG72_011738 [Tetrahymena utriculariae]